MKINRKVIAIGAGLVVAISLWAAGMFWVFGQIEQSTLARQHNRIVTVQAANFLAALVDAETGERGFAITGNEVYLEPYLGSSLLSVGNG